LDAASKLADQLPDGESKNFLKSVTELYREYAIAWATQKEGASLDSVQQHLRTALERLQRVREEYPELWESAQPMLGGLQTSLEGQIRLNESILMRTPDESPDDARTRLRRIIMELIDSLPQDDPNRRLYQGVLDFSDASGPLRESGRALGRMNLEDAKRYIDEASRMLHRAEDAWKGEPSPHIQPMQRFGAGFRMLIDAQLRYMRTLRDAVVGDVTNRHVADLTVADDELIQGLKQIETWGPRMVEFLPQEGQDLDIPELRAMVSYQREILRNFRSLVRQGTQAKQVLLRATPMFLVYFAISFFVVLFGAKWSTVVPELDVTYVAGIALTVSAFSAYGFAAGRQVLSALWPSQKSGGSDTKSPKSPTA
jgi:hypothetical protein